MVKVPADEPFLFMVKFTEEPAAAVPKCMSAEDRV
jgi:hypothetical protein